MNKRQKLTEQLDICAKQDVCIAFSGGVDSSLLLNLAVEAAKKYGTKVYAVTFNTVLHPKNDVEISRQVATELGAIHQVVEVNELEHPGIQNNDVERCYYCKKSLFVQLQAFANERKIQTIMEGTNHDDLSAYRPGIRAIREMNILSPLAEAQLTKQEVREWAGELGISVAQRPSAPCMATRLPYGAKVDIELLQRIDEGEGFLRELGFVNVRLRVHGDIARIEVDQADIGRVVAAMETIIKRLKALEFTYITVDLEGFRSGSMDVFRK